MISTPAALGHAPTRRKITEPGPEWLPCTCLEIVLRDATGGGDGIVTVAFRGYGMSAWSLGDMAEDPTRSWHSWMFGPGVASPQALLDRDGYALHVRLDSTVAVGRLEIERGHRAAVSSG